MTRRRRRGRRTCYAWFSFPQSLLAAAPARFPSCSALPHFPPHSSTRGLPSLAYPHFSPPHFFKCCQSLARITNPAVPALPPPLPTQTTHTLFSFLRADSISPPGASLSPRAETAQRSERALVRLRIAATPRMRAAHPELLSRGGRHREQRCSGARLRSGA